MAAPPGSDGRAHRGGWCGHLLPQPPAPAARPVSSPSTPATASPAPSEPSGIAGQTLPWATSLRIQATGAQPGWLSPASGHSEPIIGLPYVSSGYQFIRTVGGWAVQANPGGLLECSECAEPSMPVWFLADGARSVTRVGTATLVAPSATAGAVWLTSYQPTADADTAVRTAREVSAAPAARGPGHAPVRVRDLPGDRPRAAARADQPAVGRHGVQALEPGCPGRQPHVRRRGRGGPGGHRLDAALRIEVPGPGARPGGQAHRGRVARGQFRQAGSASPGRGSAGAPRELGRRRRACRAPRGRVRHQRAG